jgi:hypothetical protein
MAVAIKAPGTPYPERKNTPTLNAMAAFQRTVRKVGCRGSHEAHFRDQAPVEQLATKRHSAAA